MNWYRISQKGDKFSGNCGMYAIALGKKAIKDGNSVEIIILSNAEDKQELEYGDAKIYHVGVLINGQVQDGRGLCTLKDLVKFTYDIYRDSRPYIYFFILDDVLINLIRRNTNWDTSWEEYYNEIYPSNLKRHNK